MRQVFTVLVTSVLSVIATLMYCQSFLNHTQRVPTTVPIGVASTTLQVSTTSVTANNTTKDNQHVLPVASVREYTSNDGTCRLNNSRSIPTSTIATKDGLYLIGECWSLVHDEMVPFHFMLYVNKDRFLQHIYVENPTHVMQDVAFEDKFVEPQNNPEDTFSLVDINFDGYKDIRFGIWWGNHGDVGYGFRIYDPATGTFIHDNQFSEFENPRIDEQAKCIYQSHHYGFLGDLSSMTCLRDEEMVLMKETQRSREDPSACYQVTTKERQQDGSMQTEHSEECDRG